MPVVNFVWTNFCVLINTAVITTVCLSKKLGKIHALLSNLA